MIANEKPQQEPNEQGFAERMQAAMLRNVERAPDDIYAPPSKTLFSRDGEETDYLFAPDLAAIGHRLIYGCQEFSHLRELDIAFLWKKEGGEKHGQAVLGKCTKPSGLVRHFTTAQWVIWLAADYALGLTRFQVEAILHHELQHAGYDGSEDMKPKVFGHDTEAFLMNIKRYGAWMESLKQWRDVWQQLALPLG